MEAKDTHPSLLQRLRTGKTLRLSHQILRGPQLALLAIITTASLQLPIATDIAMVLSKRLLVYVRILLSRGIYMIVQMYVYTPLV